MSYTIGWVVPKKEQKNVVEQIIELDGEKIFEEVKKLEVKEEVKEQPKKRIRKKKVD